MGREVGPLFTNKKTPEAQRLGSLARTMLGELKARMKALGLLMGVQKKVLPDGSSIKVFSNRGIDKAILEVPEKAKVECKKYVESGRQWWGPLDTDRGYIQISTDIEGSNGPASPAQAISEGLSLALGCKTPSNQSACNTEVYAKKVVRKTTPASSFTGKLAKLIQCVYGTKRTDISSIDPASLILAGVELTHTFSRSSILYTDAKKNYWMLQIIGLESASIQAWTSPCNSNIDTVEYGKEAYHLFSLIPKSSVFSILCSGTEELLETHRPMTNGWHATQRGDVGHICLIGAPTGGLYKYELSDSGIAKQPGQTDEEYIASRFSITFSNVASEQFTSLAGLDRVLIPYYTEDCLQLGATVTSATNLNHTFVQPSFPIYCRYRLDDTLDVIYYEAVAEAEQADVDHTGIDSCSSLSCTQAITYGHNGVTSGFTIASISPKTYPNKVTKEYIQLEREVGGGRGWKYYVYGLGCDMDDPILDKFTEMVERGCAFIDVGVYISDTTDTRKEGTLVQDTVGGQALVIPFYAHESFSIFELGIDKTYLQTSFDQYTGAYITEAKFMSRTCEETINVEGFVSNYYYADDNPHDEHENTDWNFHYSLKGTYFPHVGDVQEIVDFDAAYGGTPVTSLSCGDQASGTEAPGSWFFVLYCPDNQNPLCEDAPFYNSLFSLSTTIGGKYVFPKIAVLESYQFGHTNGYFDEDKEYTIHRGYQEFREECAFTGKS